MEGCIFCKIAKGEIDSAKIYEDENCLAFLDLNPAVKGMTVLIPKKHFGSYAFEMPDEDYKNLMLTAKKIGLVLDKKLGIQRTALVAEGMGVNHAHVKLYPLPAIDEFKVQEPKERIFFEKYEGHISTQLGPKADINELKKLAKSIRNSLAI